MAEPKVEERDLNLTVEEFKKALEAKNDALIDRKKEIDRLRPKYEEKGLSKQIGALEQESLEIEIQSRILSYMLDLPLYTRVNNLTEEEKRAIIENRIIKLKGEYRSLLEQQNIAARPLSLVEGEDDLHLSARINQQAEMVRKLGDKAERVERDFTELELAKDDAAITETYFTELSLRITQNPYGDISSFVDSRRGMPRGESFKLAAHMVKNPEFGKYKNKKSKSYYYSSIFGS